MPQAFVIRSEDGSRELARVDPRGNVVIAADLTNTGDLAGILAVLLQRVITGPFVEVPE